jgi:hypothetical protein
MAIGLVGKWALVVVVFVAIYGAIVVQVDVNLYLYDGQHTPSAELIIADDSVTQCIIAANSATVSISQFAVETLPGLIVLLSMTLIGSFILISIERDIPSRDRIWGNFLGYFLLGLVGVFSDALPGNSPRRNWNFVLLWPVASSTTNIIHVSCAAAFLFLPMLATAGWLSSRRHWGWIAAYAVGFGLNVSYGAADLWAAGNLIVPGGWFLFEVASFGYSFVLYSAFGLWRLNNNLSATSYVPLKRTRQRG